MHRRPIRALAAAAVLTLLALPAGDATAASTTDPHDGRVPSEVTADASATRATSPALVRGESRGLVRGACDQPLLTDRTGDGNPYDIETARLTGDCSTWSFTIRTARTIRIAPLNYWAVDIDLDGNNDNGCNGADRWIEVYPNARGRLTGYMLKVTSCDRSTLRLVDTIPVERPSLRSLRVNVPASFVRSQSSFRWFTSMDAIGDDNKPDAVPQRLWSVVRTPPTPPRDLAGELGDGFIALTWGAPADPGGGDITYRLSMSQDGGTPTRVALDDPAATAQVVDGLEHGHTYTFTLYAWNGAKRSAPATVTLELPLV